ncbi:MAG TPA: hypothetical protein VJL59_13570 [Anaerolineales bacterium]|nr:hypothetical protein [Anaerolineales bacterium]HLB48029.1 hypothetical protein [Anaerolineales bacterium]
MITNPFSQRAANVMAAAAPIFRFAVESPIVQKRGQPSICDFLFGDPHDMPIPAFAEALARWSVPQNKDWFAYKSNAHYLASRQPLDQHTKHTGSGMTE